MLRLWFKRSICKRSRGGHRGGGGGGAQHPRSRCRAVKSAALSASKQLGSDDEDASSEGSSSSEDAELITSQDQDTELITNQISEPLVKGDELTDSAPVQEPGKSENGVWDGQCLPTSEIANKLLVPLLPEQEPEPQTQQAESCVLPQYEVSRLQMGRLQTIIEESYLSGDTVVNGVAGGPSVSSPATVEHPGGGEDVALRSDDLDSQAIFATDASSYLSGAATVAAEEERVTTNANREETMPLTAAATACWLNRHIVDTERAVEPLDAMTPPDTATTTATCSSASVSMSHSIQLEKRPVFLRSRNDDDVVGNRPLQQQEVSPLIMLERVLIEPTVMKIRRGLGNGSSSHNDTGDTTKRSPGACKRRNNNQSPLSTSTMSSTSSTIPTNAVVGIVCDLQTSDLLQDCEGVSTAALATNRSNLSTGVRTSKASRDFYDVAHEETVETPTGFAGSEAHTKYSPQMTRIWLELETKNSSASDKEDTSDSEISQTVAGPADDDLSETPQSPPTKPPSSLSPPKSPTSGMKVKFKRDSSPTSKSEPKPELEPGSDLERFSSIEAVTSRMKAEAEEMPHLRDEGARGDNPDASEEAAAAHAQAPGMSPRSHLSQHHNHCCCGGSGCHCCCFQAPMDSVCGGGCGNRCSGCCCCNDPPAAGHNHRCCGSNVGGCYCNSGHNSCNSRVARRCASPQAANCCNCRCCCCACHQQQKQQQPAYVRPPYDPPNRYVNPHSPSQFGIGGSAEPLHWVASDPKSPTSDWRRQQQHNHDQGDAESKKAAAAAAAAAALAVAAAATATTREEQAQKDKALQLQEERLKELQQQQVKHQVEQNRQQLLYLDKLNEAARVATDVTEMYKVVALQPKRRVRVAKVRRRISSTSSSSESAEKTTLSNAANARICHRLSSFQAVTTGYDMSTAGSVTIDMSDEPLGRNRFRGADSNSSCTISASATGVIRRSGTAVVPVKPIKYRMTRP